MGGRAVCAAGLVGLAAAIACSPGVFACIESSDCRSGEVVGTCEANGWCSFPDDACPSGARYGDHAGAGLAGECVPSGSASTTGDDDTGTTASTTATTTSTSATTTTVSTATSSDPTGDPTTSVDDTDTDVALCGNGVADPGEPCDDGNEIVGDGCNPGCIPAGEVVWSIVVDNGGFDGAFTIEPFANGDLAVGVAVATDEGAQPGVWRIDADGNVIWQWSFGIEMPWSGAYTWGLDIDEAHDELIAVSAHGGSQIAIGVVDASGATRWSTLVEGTSFGIAVDTAGELWSAGYDLAGNGTFLHYSADGMLIDTLVGEPYSPDSGFPYEVIHDGGARLLTAGRYDMKGGTFAYLRTLGDMAPQADILLGEYNEGLGIAYDAIAERDWVVGYADLDGGQGWIAAYSHGEPVLAPTV
ncbi:MAG TPA: hypothetical protein VG755_02905, partial [Nannocystaceae bacterium]|nr:hypothetical protein [Nannocystaceae bacterium]